MNDVIPKELLDDWNRRLRAIGSRYYILPSGHIGRYLGKLTHNPTEENVVLFEVAQSLVARMEQAVDETAPSPEPEGGRE